MCVCECVDLCVCVCGCVRLQTEAEQLLQSFCMPRGLNVNDSVAFHSPAGGTACAHVSLPICVSARDLRPTVYSKAIDVKQSISDLTLLIIRPFVCLFGTTATKASIFLSWPLRDSVNFAA